jgi:hypothetical protein
MNSLLRGVSGGAAALESRSYLAVVCGGALVRCGAVACAVRAGGRGWLLSRGAGCACACARAGGERGGGGGGGGARGGAHDAEQPSERAHPLHHARATHCMPSENCFPYSPARRGSSLTWRQWSVVEQWVSQNASRLVLPPQVLAHVGVQALVLLLAIRL